jgi:hypothetical protein
VRAVCQVHALRLAIEAHGRKAQVQVDVVLLVMRCMTEQQSVGFHLPCQVLLGERRSLIGKEVFIPDHRQGTYVSALSQGLHGLRRRLPSANDEDGCEHAGCTL